MKYEHSDDRVPQQAYHQRSKILAGAIEHYQKIKKNSGYSSPECFANFLDDTHLITCIADLAKEKESHKVKHMFVVGIGGANLASKAIYDVLYGHTQSVKQPKQNVVFLDTDDESMHDELREYVESFKSKKEYIVIIVSKSGETLETITNAKLITGILEKKFGSSNDRIIVITKPNSPLAHSAEESAITTVLTPETLSDRFSAFSPICVIPLAFLGVDIEGFLSGARTARDESLNIDIHQNPAALSACSIDFHAEGGARIIDLFYFVPALKTLGEWDRQLIAESLGKNTTRDGVALGKTVTPVVSVGTTDLHSILQLSLSNPLGRFTQFITSDEALSHDPMDTSVFDTLIPTTNAKSTHEIVTAIYESVKQSYRTQKMPHVEVGLSDVSVRSLGEYMMFSMMSTVFVGALWNIDTFTQPMVEAYKTKARDILSK